MAEKRVTLLVCDEPIKYREEQPCGRPAVGPVVLIFGDVRRTKDLCEMHAARYQAGTRIVRKKARRG